MSETYIDWRDRRLQIARFMCQQEGLSWTGLSIAERDVFIDAAWSALKELDAGRAALAASGEE